MSRLYQPTGKRAGQAPGTLVYTGRQREDDVTIRVLDYEDGRCDETEAARLEDILPLRDAPSTTWIDVDGVHDSEILSRLGSHFGLHPLVLEDILHTSQRPKAEEYPDYIYIVCRMLRVDPQTHEVDSEQISLVCGRNFVMSFQERSGDVFDPVRERLRHGKGRIRRAGADYLAYALLDAVVDNYFVVVERYGEHIEELELAALATPSSTYLQRIHRLKREMLLVRRAVWPLREAISSILREESDLVQRETHVFLRDVYDHAVQVADIVETFRDTLTGLQDLYLSNLSHQMNEVMKVLTIISTIFVPLTFFAGIWGMNFAHMPELQWRWGYAGAWALFVGIFVAMLLYFRRKRWL